MKNLQFDLYISASSPTSFYPCTLCRHISGKITEDLSFKSILQEADIEEQQFIQQH